MHKSIEQRIEELEKKVAALEVQAQEQPSSDFANYLLRCTIQYQLMMSKSNDHPQF